MLIGLTRLVLKEDLAVVPVSSADAAEARVDGSLMDGSSQ